MYTVNVPSFKANHRVLTADFRHIGFAGEGRNCEQLFRAAVSAFCSLSRPSRREIAQLDDLTLGLYESVSPQARRFAAAALCECRSAPPGIVRRLSGEPVEISAPLLVRSQNLRDADLIALIARHGLSHARVIARRDNLHPVIASLIRTLIARAQAESSAPSAPEAADKSLPQPSERLEPVRDQLREIMRRSPDSDPSEVKPPVEMSGIDGYSSLLEPALEGDLAAFSAALAGICAIREDTAQEISGAVSYSDLMLCLRAANLSAEQAYVVTAAVFPAQLTHPSAISLFLKRFHATSEDAAREKLENWRRMPEAEDLLAQSLAIAK